MADENAYPQQPLPGEGERIGFCQDCGRPLTAATIRTVGPGVFCEPCLERRLAGSPYPGGSPYAAPGYGAPPTGAANTPPPPPYSFGSAYPPPDGVFPPLDGSTPHPFLAGFLGLIPGVGAMYNGQFAKGFVHLIAFVVLVSLSDNVNGVFGLLVAGWIFYMVFDAYQTAKARRTGLPLPDPFGLNNIGDRMGVKNWNPNAAPKPPAPGGVHGGDWVGYVPPTGFATTPPAAGSYVPPAVPPFVPSIHDMPVPPPHQVSFEQQYAENLEASIKAQILRDAGHPYVVPAYAPTFTGAPVMDGSGAVIPPSPVKRFPIGAMWLIGLGLLFLLGNIDPNLRLSWRWILPAALAILAIWIFVRRVSSAGSMGQAANIVCSLRVPLMLMTLAVLLALQTGHFLTLGQTWPVFFIVLGAVLLLERTAGRAPYIPQLIDSPTPQPTPLVNPEDAPLTSTRWHATGDAAAKGGQ